MSAFLHRLKEVPDEQWAKLREALILHEVSLRNVLMLYGELFGTTPANVGVLKTGPILAGVLPLAPPRPPPLQVVRRPSAAELVAAFDMEAAIKNSGAWECGDMHCVSCPLAQNLRCIQEYQILAPPNVPGQTDLTVRLRLHKAERDKYGTCEKCGRTDVLKKPDGSLTFHDDPNGINCNLPTSPPPKRWYCQKCGEEFTERQGNKAPPHADGRCAGAGLPMTNTQIIPEVKLDGTITGGKTKTLRLPLGSVARINGKVPKPYSPQSSFDQGDIILHPKWGNGKVTVVDRSQQGNQKIVVHFDRQDIGDKTLAMGRK